METLIKWNSSWISGVASLDFGIIRWHSALDRQQRDQKMVSIFKRVILEILYRGLAAGHRRPFMLTVVLRTGAAGTGTSGMFRTITYTIWQLLQNYVSKKESLCGSRESELIKVGEQRIKRIITVGDQLPPEGDIWVSLQTVIRYK